MQRSICTCASMKWQNNNAITNLQYLTGVKTAKRFGTTSNSFGSKLVSKHEMKDLCNIRISDYNCIGFDLDNTVCRYKLTNMVKLEYDVLSRFLVDNKGHDADFLLRPIEENMDFIQKGLVMDFLKGNVLRLGPGGYIQKASHGTRMMSDAEIVAVYGEMRHWDIATIFSKDMLVAWNGPLSERLRTLLDYFDMPTSLIFARIVDSIDSQHSTAQPAYKIWPDVLDGLVYMYSREHFALNEGGYFPAIKAHPEKYIHKTTPVVVEWLKRLRDNNILTFLVTGSHADFASFTARHSLGENWRDLFDIIISFARKPGFFTECRPFIELKGIDEAHPMDHKDLQLGSMYSQGNWGDLMEAMSRHINNKSPKVLYVGDNLIQDVYTPSNYSQCDTIAISEEMLAEGMVDSSDTHTDYKLLTSSLWGSYFCNVSTAEPQPSIWTDVIRKHSKMCIPTLESIAEKSLDYEFKCFTEQQSCCCGFYPGMPLSTHRAQQI